jgi:magnesium chelatase family protein
MMNSAMLRKFAPLDKECSELLERAMTSLELSSRAYDRIIKVARTIADLEGVENINKYHIAEAVSYRKLDREKWVERYL